MSNLTKVEKRFVELEGDGKLLIFQPNILYHGAIKWRPDFIDSATGIYYEVVGARATYYQHRDKGHFEFMLKHNLPLMIAHYIKPVLGGNYEVIIPDRFIVRFYTSDHELRIVPIQKKGGLIMAHIQASIDYELQKEVKKIAIDEDITISDYVQKALREQVKRSKEDAEAKQLDTNITNLTQEKES